MEIIYLSTVEIRRTAKLRFLKSSVQHWKWWLCKSSRSHLQLSLGLRNIWYGCHSRFLSASEASEPPVSHTSTSPSARGAYCCSAIRWKCALGKFSPGMLCESCPTPPGHVFLKSYSTSGTSMRKLAPSRNVLNNKSATVVYTGDLFTGMDFDTISVCVQPRLFMKNVDFRNRQRLKVS